MIRLFRYFTQFKVVRFLVSGSIAACITISTVFILTEIYEVWYLIATTIASLLAIGVNFTLQKFWTFREKTYHRAHAQTLRFFTINGINLVLNGLLMIFFVEYVGLWPVFAQVCSGGLIAIESFLVYSVIFRTPAEDQIHATPSDNEALSPHAERVPHL